MNSQLNAAERVQVLRLLRVSQLAKGKRIVYVMLWPTVLDPVYQPRRISILKKLPLPLLPLACVFHIFRSFMYDEDAMMYDEDV